MDNATCDMCDDKGRRSHQLELIFRTSHLTIQSSHLMFTFSAAVHSSVFTHGKFGKIFSLHFFTWPKDVSSLSSQLRNHNPHSSQKPGYKPKVILEIRCIMFKQVLPIIFNRSP